MARSSTRRRRVLPRWSEGVTNLHDYLLEPHGHGAAIREEGDGPIVISDDLPPFVPITEAELRVIEAYFAKELDALFGPLP